MSANQNTLRPERLERLLFDLGIKRDVKSAFKADPDKLLQSYRLTEAEARLVKEFDVYELARIGVNSMALMGYWIQNEPSRSLSAYLQKLKGPQ